MVKRGRSCIVRDKKTGLWKLRWYERLKGLIYNKFNKNSGRNTYKRWLKGEIARAKERELAGSDKNDVFVKYSLACIDSAGELAKIFSKQGHSGLSASLTLSIFNNLAKWKPLSPLTGTDDEWNLEDPEFTKSAMPEYSAWYQNKRDSALFKYVKADGTVKYRHNDILEVVNYDDVIATYSFTDNIDSSITINSKLQKFYDKADKLRESLNNNIEFPYVFKSYKVKWDFNTEEFKADEN